MKISVKFLFLPSILSAIMLFSIPVNAEVVQENGSLLEFFAGQEGGCAYDNWISHTSEYDYFGYSANIPAAGRYFAPAELDLESNGFGAYTIASGQALSEWASIFDAFVQGNANSADNLLTNSSFSNAYELVQLTDGGNDYLMLREVLNGNTDDNGTGDQADDVTGSFDYGWGLFILNLSPDRPQVIIEVVHPSTDYIAPYVAIDAFLTMDAGFLFVNGASRNIAWIGQGDGDPYGSAISLSDPSRNAATPFHEAHKAAVDATADEWVIQIHSYNDTESHIGINSVQLSAEREGNTNLNPPIMSWNNIDVISLTPNPPVANGGGWAYPSVGIDEYYAAYYPGGYKYNGTIAISNNIDLPGTSTNNQMVYTHQGHDFVNDKENWLHIELDEYPDVLNDYGEDILDFYQYNSLGVRVPTHENYALIMDYYRPVFTAAAAYMDYQPTQAAYVQETAPLAEFYQGSTQGSAYDNWVSHVSEGIADPGYNDYGPALLDRQTNGFGDFKFIPTSYGGTLLMSYWRQIFDAFMQNDDQTVRTLLTEAELGDYYQIVRMTDGGDEYLILREVLNNSYTDDNGTGDGADDVTGSFDYGWGLYVLNVNATRPQVIIEIPHPGDDYTSPAIGFDAFKTIDAGLMFVAGAGREVMWTEVAPYFNSKSLSDPTRNADHPFQAAHEAAVDLHGGELVIQIHTYDSSHNDPEDKDTELSAKFDLYPNPPLMDAGSHFDIISLTPEFPITANTIAPWAHSSVRIDEYYALYYEGGYYHNGNILITNEIDQPGYSGNLQRNYSHIGHDVNADDENWIHVEHDEFPDVVESGGTVENYYNAGSGVADYTNYADVVAYFHPLYLAVSDYYDGPNFAPTWTDTPTPISVDEDVLISFTVTGSDPDGDGLSISLDDAELPGGHSFSDNGDGTGDFSWQTAAGDAGEYTITFTLSDGDLNDIAAVSITVVGAAAPQVATASAEQAVSGTVQGNYTLTATSDNNRQIITERESGGRRNRRHSFLEHIWTFDVTGFDLVLNAEAHHSSNNEGDDFILSGSFDGNNYTDLITVTKTSDDDSEQSAAINGTATGTYYVKVVDTDQTQGNNSLDAFHLDAMSITYMSGPLPNQAPSWTDVPANANGDEGDEINFTVTGTDPEGDNLSISYSGDVPNGYNFTDNGDGSASFTWQTADGDAGDYNAEFTISDGELTDVASVSISISVPGQGSSMHISAIEMSAAGKKNKRGQALITILDQSDQPVSGATVFATWSDLTNADVQGQTDGSGQILFETSSVRNANGYFTMTVTDVTLANWTYDTDANATTSESFGVGDFAAGWDDLILGQYLPMPKSVLLNPAFPNPFNDHTVIQYGLPEDGTVTLTVYNMLGKRVSILSNRTVGAGWHQSVWTPTNLANGEYIVRLQFGSDVSVQRLLYLK